MSDKFATSKNSVTRPADTTTYAAGDAVGGIQTFANAVKSAGDHGAVYNAWVVLSANQTLKPALELWLFSVAPAAVADNAAVAFTDAEMLNFLGILTFTNAFVGNAGAGTSGNCVMAADSVINAAVLQQNGSSVYGQLVARNAYIPISEEVITTILNISQD